MATYQIGEIDNVNPATGNVYLNLPLLSYPQRGHALRLTFRIFYNDKNWFIYNYPQQRDSNNRPLGAVFWTSGDTSGPAHQVASGNSVYVARDQHLDFGWQTTTNQDNETTGSNGGGGYTFTTYVRSSFVRETNGSRHYYNFQQDQQCSAYGTGTCPSTAPSVGKSYAASDSSGYAAQQNSNSLVGGPDGVLYTYDPQSLLDTITDPSGNTIQATNVGWVDSIGRTVPGSRASPGNATGTSYEAGTSYFSSELIPGIPESLSSACPPGSDASRLWNVPSIGTNATLTYHLCYSPISWQTNFNAGQVLNNPALNGIQEASGTADALTAIVLPNNQMYTFSYDSYGSLSQLTLPTGGSVSYVWQNVIPAPYNPANRPLTRALQSRTITPGNGQPSRSWTYAWSQLTTSYDSGPPIPSGNLVITTDPAGNDVEREISGYGVTSLKAYAGCSPRDTAASRTCNGSGPTLMRQEDYTLTTTGSLWAVGSPAGDAVQYQAVPTTTTVTLPSNTGNIVSQTVTTLTPAYSDCDTYGIPTGPGQYSVSEYTVKNCLFYTAPESVATYDYGAGQPGPLLTQHGTTYKYQTTPSYQAANLFSFLDTETVSDSSGVTAQTVHGYDSVGDETSTTRGLGADQATTLTEYNAQGMPTKITNPRGYATTYGYDSTGAFLSSTTHPATSGVQHQEGYIFDANTGKITSHTDENQNVTSYSYLDPSSGAPDPLNRLRKITYPSTGDGNSGGTAQGYTQLNYVDTPGALSVQTVGLMSSAGASKSLTTSYDGVGDVISTSLDHDPEGAVLVKTNYDELGRVASVSNPYRGAVNGSSTYSYDALGRTTTVTQPDNNTQRWSYNGNVVTFTDEDNHSWARTMDGAGRLAAVTEPGMLSTTYNYDAMGDLTAVTQTGTASESPHNRHFLYDSLSRLKMSCDPEHLPTGSTALCDGTSWPQAYSYDADGNVISETDPSNTTITYSFDPLDRIMSKASAQDAEFTHQFTYDQGANGVGRLSIVSDPVYTGQTQNGTKFAYDAMGRVTNEDWFNYQAQLWQQGMAAKYDLAGNITQLTYPDNRVVGQMWSQAGRLVSISDTTSGVPKPYLSNVSYWPSGAVEGETYGNGVTQSLQLNSRLQLCHQSASSPLLPTGSGGGNVFDRQLFYSATSPVETNCSTATGNNGSIWQVLEGVGSGTGQTFSYDQLNRLVTAFSVNRPAAATYNQTFSYDSFGNMLPIDNLHSSLNYSRDLLTNRLLLNGTDLQYNNAGRLTQAPNPLGGAHTFGYTAEGYLRKVDNFQTGSYLYNGQGQQTLSVSNDNGSGANFNWYEFVYLGGQMMAHVDYTGLWTDYVYANGEKIARAQNKSTQIHFKGTNCTGCGGPQRWSYYLPLINYTVQSGDHIGWRQMQTGPAVPRGGVTLRFTDGTYTNWVTQDQNGEVMNSLSVQGAWVARVVDLSAFAGKTQDLSWINEDAQSGPGDWEERFADIALIHADGSVMPIYNGQSSFSPPSCCFGDPGVTNQTIEVEQASDSDPLSTTKYYLADQVGTTQYELAAGGWPVWQGFFTPFGQEIVNGGTQNALGQVPDDGTTMPFKFTGKERDSESGLDYFGARYYASSMGRFSSPDDGRDQVAEDPQSWNLYSYVQNNPLINVDPDGHDCVTQTATSGGGETATVQTGGCSGAAGNGTTKTYIAGTVTSLGYASDGKSLNVDYNAYGSDPNTSASTSSLDRAPAPDNPGIALGYNQAGFSQLRNTAGVVNYFGGIGMAGISMGMGEVLAGTMPEIGMAGVGNTRVVFNLAHGIMDVRDGHLPPPGTIEDVKAAVSAALNEGKYSTSGNGVVNGTTTIHGVEVGFRGKVVNGVMRIATVFTKR